MLQLENYTPQPGTASSKPNSGSSVESLVTAVRTADNPGTNTTFEGLIADVEHCVPDAGQLLLFLGEHLRLEVMLLRKHQSRVIWGIKRHEDWAFKATLLRFARGNDTVHLILSTEHEGGYRIRGWVVKRTKESFWASPLPTDQVNSFWERCLTPIASGKIESRRGRIGARADSQRSAS